MNLWYYKRHGARKSEAVPHSSDSGGDILISWDVKYIPEDKREKERREEKRAAKTKRIYNKERGRERSDRSTTLQGTRYLDST